MTTSFTNIVNRYLSSEIPYALLIDGKWGSGKTWYLKNKFEDDFSRKIIYTSANGITSMDDLTQQILYRKLYLSSNLVSDPKAKLAYSIVKEFGKSMLNKYTGFNIDDLSKLNVNLNDFASISDNEVLIIDDIERMSGGLIEELLGFVSKNFTEENGFKVILVADEIKLTEKYGVDEKKYLEIKEKTIWQTISFQLDYEKIVPSLTSKYLNSIHKFYPEFNQDVILFLKEHKISNLRTILYSFINIDEVYLKIENKDQLPTVVKSIMILTNEYKAGNLNARMGEEIPSYIKTITPTFSIKWFKDAVDFIPTDIDIFSNTYLDDSSIKYYYFESLYHLICHGFLDDKLLMKEIADCQNFLKSPCPSIEVIHKMFNFRKLTDEEFNEIVKEVLVYFNKGTYDLLNATNIIKYFEYFFEYDMLEFSLEEFELKLEENIIRIDTNQKLPLIAGTFLDQEDTKYLSQGEKIYNLVQQKITEYNQFSILEEKKYFIEALQEGKNLPEPILYLFEKFDKQELLDLADFFTVNHKKLLKLYYYFESGQHYINDLEKVSLENYNYFFSSLKERLKGQKIAMIIIKDIEKLKKLT